MMKRLLIMALAVAGIGSLAPAADVNLDVQSSGGMSEITVMPGALVEYQVIALLSDNANEGLALLGFDLEFSGGPLTLGDRPTSGPAMAFDRPDGLTNPGPGGSGYGGTEIGGRLVQVGGGQNTIKNGQLACTGNEDCPTGSTCDANFCTPVAAFPVGLVITGVAEPAPEGMGPAVMATGSLTAPMTEDDYILSIPMESVFANVIKEGETGEIFYATEPAGENPTITNLLIHVTGEVPANLTGSVPACDSTVPGSAGNIIDLTFDGPIAAPAAGEIEIQQLAAAGGFTGGELSASFTYTVQPGNILRIKETGTVFSDKTWYAIRNTGGWSGVAPFKVDFEVAIGDANEDGFVLSSDVLLVNGSVGCFSNCDPRLDINGDGFILSSDVLAANARVGNFGTAKPSGHSCSP
jgi:hypothetical protein